MNLPILGGFVEEVGAHLIADLVILLFGAIAAWMISLRGAWSLVFSVFRLARNGVCKIYLNRSEYISRRAIPVEEYIKAAKRDFIYVGLYFSVATDQSRIDNSLIELVKRRCKIGIYLLDENASDEVFDYLESFLGFAKYSLRPRARHALEHFKTLKSSLAPAERDFITIGLHRFPLVTSAFLMDGGEELSRMLVDIKWFGVGRDKSTGIEFSGSTKANPLFETMRASVMKTVAAAEVAR